MLDADGVEGCPDAGELRRSIAGHLGRDPFEDADAPRVAVRVRSSASGASADVVLGETHRTIEGASCADVVRASALSLALAIEREAERPPPAPPPPPPAPPPPVAREAPPPEASPSVRDDRVVATASALTTVGLLPRAAPGFGAGARVRVAERVWISARGFALPYASMPNDAFAMRLFAGGAGACVEPAGTKDVALVGCGHLLAGSFEVRDATDPLLGPSAALYLGASLAAGVRARIAGPLSVEGGIDGQFPFTRPTFLAATCPPTGFEPPFAALALWLGAGISLR